jgi:hypothetical protein
MITEYIKRGHRKGYDENGNLVYKVPVNQPAPELPLEDEVEEDEED